jgi:hypothetical protein
VSAPAFACAAKPTGQKTPSNSAEASDRGGEAKMRIQHMLFEE